MSRYVVAVIVALVALGAFFVLNSKQIPEFVPQVTEQSVVAADEEINEDSQTKETLRGYYMARSDQGTIEGPDYKYTCDAFVVTSTGPLVDYFSNMVNQGNTVNRRDSEGRLLLNLDMSSLTDTDKLTLENSDAQQQVFLEVQKKFQYGKGVDSCYSFVDIVKVGL